MEEMVLVRPGAKTRIGELLRMLRTSKSAYERAYDKASDRGLRDLFGVLASSRISMINELEDELHAIQLSDQLQAPGTDGGRWSNMWREIRNPSWLLGNGALLNTVNWSEHRLLSVYDRNLFTEELPESLAQLLGSQRVQVLENVDNIGLFLRSVSGSGPLHVGGNA